MSGPFKRSVQVRCLNGVFLCFAIVILFARDIAERERCRQEHREYLLQQCDGVKVLSSLDLEAIPPFTYAHEHFGYRDRLSQLCIEGMGEEPTPGSSPPIKPGEFFLGYPDEEGPSVGLPEPEVLSRNGSYVAYLRLEEHVGAFRDFLREHGDTPEQQEWVAAKLMGRWRSGAPLVLSPDKDDPELGKDMQRNNNFDYAKMDPYGYGCPLGAHIRRMNPRDTAVNMQRRKMIRRGGTYGPALPATAGRRCSRSVKVTAMSPSASRSARRASHVGPSVQTTRTPTPMVSASTSGYRQEIRARHARHRPPRAANDRSGTLS